MVFNPPTTLKPFGTSPRAMATVSPITSYFAALNGGDYATAAACFAPTGQLIPPFEQAITGPTAIARYLHKESPGMIFTVEEMQAQGESHYYLRGKARSSWFNLSVAWEINLNGEGAIAQLQIHLLAKPEELLMVRPG